LQGRIKGKGKKPPKKKKKPNPKKRSKGVKSKRKIQIYPNKDQKTDLERKWMGTVRWTYNQCLNSINKKECKLTKKKN